MKSGFLAAFGLLAAMGDAFTMEPVWEHSYGGWGAPFAFRTPNQRKRRRANRQQGSKSRRLKP